MQMIYSDLFNWGEYFENGTRIVDIKFTSELSSHVFTYMYFAYSLANSG